MLDYLLWTFYIVVSIQSLYYLLFLTPFVSNKKKPNKTNKSISVIVCAKNEANNLKIFLPKILNQKYDGSFEVVVINDRSTDDTATVIHSFKNSYSNLKIVSIEDCENFWGNKKYALTLGIKAANYEHLLFTDADCYPNSTKWIQEMASCITDNKNIVLGYGGYKKANPSFINKLIRFETLITATQYFSYAKLGIPYMGVGRNLAYKKSIFFDVKGFIKHIQVKSGDDDLFINEVANSTNTAINLCPNSFTTSIPKENFKDWITQKRRHISTASYYKLKHKFLLSLFHISQVLFFCLSLFFILNTINLTSVFVLVGIRYLTFFTSLSLFSNKLKEKDLILLFPFLEIALILSQLYIYLLNKISSPVTWK